MSLIPPWLRLPRIRERLASYHLRSDVLDAAAAMASDQRSDIYVVRLESSLTDDNPRQTPARPGPTSAVGQTPRTARQRLDQRR